MSEEKKVILVAEDSASNRKIICQMLSKFGFDVIDCVDGEDAYNKATEAIDSDSGLQAIMTDIMMPGMSGLDFVEKLQKQAEIGEIPLLFLTAVAERDQVIRARKLGARGYLLKPITRDKLRNKCIELFPDHIFTS